jgi:tetratricopeptide (TPR) repeat protein
MRDAGIGRLVVASLHQAIAEFIPSRLDFYEGWLSAEGFRDGHLDLAGLFAVFSFLRTEGPVYDAVVRRAGECAAEWYLAAMPRPNHALVRALPPWLRIRRVCGLARRLALQSYKRTRVATRWRAGVGRLDIRGSLFCDVRTTVAEPLCGYYAAVVESLLRDFALTASVRIAGCRAMGAEGCTVEVVSAGAQARGTTLALCLLPILASAFGTSAAAQVAPFRVPSNPPAALQRAEPPDAAPGGILVMPFEFETRESRYRWLSEAAAVLVTEALERDGAAVISRDERLRAFDRLQVPPLAALSRATVIRVGQLLGASAVVTGTIGVAGDVLSVKARCIRLSTGRMEGELGAEGPLTGLFDLFDRLSGGLQLTGSPAGSGRDPRPRPALGAFENYVRGLVGETPAAQLASLNAAVAAAPGFDAARLAAWKVYTSAGDHKGALKVLEPVGESAPAYVAARFLMSCSQIALKQHAEALTTLTALLKRSQSPSVLNNIGIVQLRLSGASAESGGRPTWYFNQARELDPLDPDFVFNLGYAYWVEKDAGAATYWLKEAVRLDPADGAAHAVLSQALRVSGAAAEAARELELAQQLSSAYDAVGRRGADDAVLRGLGRLKDRLGPPHAQRVEAVLEAGGQRERGELAAIYLERGRRLFAQERDREASAELRRALYLSPYQAEAHLLLGRIYLRTGRLRDAIDELKISLWSEETASAHLALAEAYVQAKNDAFARVEAERVLAIDPGSLPARLLLDRLGPPRGGALPI